tara:strand:- start:163 stop:588 length:426 start_codon:yes stop_codon:yes gene_type:complete
MRYFWTTVILSFLGSIGSTVLTERFLEHRIPIIGSFMGLQKSTNAGVAFGLELGWIEPFLIAIAFCVLLWVVFKTAHTQLSQVGYGLILGGGLANILDRLHDGYVTDLFQVGSFPIFNVADACITVGVSLLLLEIILETRN